MANSLDEEKYSYPCWMPNKTAAETSIRKVRFISLLFCIYNDEKRTLLYCLDKDYSVMMITGGVLVSVEESGSVVALGLEKVAWIVCFWP